jgi:hypothetical protein
MPEANAAPMEMIKSELALVKEAPKLASNSER